jgi:uncharacterized protein YqgC (DUF456 family)
MLLGLFGLVFPIFPGLLVMWLAALGYGVASGFSTAGIVIFVIISILALFGSIVDNILMGVSARQKGASWWVILVAMAVGLVGTLVFPPIGGIVAPRRWSSSITNRAISARPGWDDCSMTGWGFHRSARFAIGLAVMGLWWLWVWFEMP